MKRYKLTPEHKARLVEWRDIWIARAMSTEPMSSEECAIATDAVRGLYAAANLPAPVAVVMAGGPISATIAAGIAAAVWYLREHPERHVSLCGRQMSEGDLMRAAAPACALAVAAAHDVLTVAPTLDVPMVAPVDATSAAATRDAARAATLSTTLAATMAATQAWAWDVVWDATSDATWAATRAATSAATSDAIWAATWAATSDAIWAATSDATRGVTKIPPFFAHCIKSAYNSMADGGNCWPGPPSFVSFFKHVAGLQLDYSHWEHYEQLAIHSGPRLMHRRFCVVSDRPTVLKIDEQRRPHCADGPSHVWRDGFRLYYWHGVRVPAQWIEAKDTVDPHLVLTWESVEQRRALAEILGWKRVLEVLSPTIIDTDEDASVGVLLEVDLPDAPGSRFLRVRCGTGREFALSVPPEMTTALQANAWTYGIDGLELRGLEART